MKTALNFLFWFCFKTKMKARRRDKYLKTWWSTN